MSEMVSTRGVKFKFSIGERVLCYEPDPTKAKVLYESKVLELVVSKDPKGRKIPEYLIHFFGWNSSWDRCVKEEFILSFTEENRELQTKLAKEAALSIKGKRKNKLPSQFKDLPNKKQCLDSGNEKTESSVETSSEVDTSEEEETEKEVKLDLPDVLKMQLEEDYRCITQNSKLVQLPCLKNVIDILEAYVKHQAAKLLCVSPPRNSTNGLHLMPEDVEKKLTLSKEVVDGIRVYFDFTLPHLLLYRQEKKQYYTDGMSCCPSNDTEIKEQLEIMSQPMLKIEIDSPVKDLLTPKAEPMSPPLRKKVRGRPPLRNQAPKDGIATKLEPMSPKEVKENTRAKSPVFQAVEKPTKISPLSIKKPRPVSTRILRSTDRQCPTKENECNSHISQPAVEADALHEPPIDIPNNAQGRITRKCVLRSSTSPPPPTHRSSSMSPPHNPSILKLATIAEKNMLPPHSSNLTAPHTSRSYQNASPIVPHSSKTSQNTRSLSNCSGFLAPPSLSNCISSSNSSSQSSMSNPSHGQQYHLINNAGFLKEVSSWRMLPSSVYTQVPPAPSLIYGAQHLLRLFVKLPSLISKMNIRQKKIRLLLKELQSFILYLEDQKDELFLASAYIEVLDSSQIAIK